MMTQKSVIYSEKSIHTQPITGISASKQNENLFLTISEDQTMRLYDLRLSSSVKLFNMGKMNDCQTANCLLGETAVYGVRDDQIQYFDLRQEIIIKECKNQWIIESEINQITFNPEQQLISANCDSGNSYILDKELNIQANLIDGHDNISYSGDFIMDEGQQYYISTGFDYKIILWDYQKQQSIQQDKQQEQFQLQVQQAKTLNKFDLKSIHETYAPLTVSPPIIYSAVSRDNTILISTETGQVYNFKVQQLKKKKNKKLPVPEYVIDAHKTKVMRATYFKDKILTVSTDMTFALFEQNNELFRAKIHNKPNWIEGVGDKFVIIGDVSNKLQIYEIV